MTAPDSHVSDAPPCKDCPWRTANQGKRHPDGWYTVKNLRRLWTGIKDGEAQSCHPTDPNNEVSPAAQAAGYRPAPEGSAVLECRGAVILAQREMMLLSHRYGDDVSAYRRARPRGLTRRGIAAVAMRIAFGHVALLGGKPMGRPDLNAEVSHPALPWTAPETSDELREQA